MKRNDWLCPLCGREMLRTSDEFITCTCGLTKLYRAASIIELPLASRVKRRTFRIDGEAGLWEYIPHAHKDALDHCPAPGVIVALVVGKRACVRSLRPVKPKTKETAP